MKVREVLDCRRCARLVVEQAAEGAPLGGRGALRMSRHPSTPAGCLATLATVIVEPPEETTPFGGGGLLAGAEDEPELREVHRVDAVSDQTQTRRRGPHAAPNYRGAC